MPAFPTTPPSVGPPAVIGFPPVVRDRLSNGLAVWVIEQARMPVVSLALLIDRGTSSDPDDRPGLVALSADLLDEGAGNRDAIQLAEAFEGLGSHLGLDVGPDVMRFDATTLTRFLAPVLDLVGDVVSRPRFGETDFSRVRDLRIHRLRQLSRQPAAVADRAFLTAVFGSHPYGHGAIGTTASLEAIVLDDARRFLRDAIVPGGSTLVVSGDVRAADVMASAESAFSEWTGSASAVGTPTSVPGQAAVSSLIDRPEAPQSVLRVGHGGPARRIDEHHDLLVLNAVLGGQFSSRINQKLREEKGLTYGARTSFGFRRATGSFACETSVDADRTVEAIEAILYELEAIREEVVVTRDELTQAKAALCRGYARNFETVGQLAHAATQLAIYDLPDSAFDEFVSGISAVTGDAVTRAAATFLRPDESNVIVVGDTVRYRTSIGALGRQVAEPGVEF
jgi:predicted Zn-dependent peptidase